MDYYLGFCPTTLHGTPVIDEFLNAAISQLPPPPSYSEAVDDLPPEYPLLPPLAHSKDPIEGQLAPAKTTRKTRAKSSVALPVEPVLDISIDLETPSGIREHKGKKKKTKATQQAQKQSNDSDNGGDKQGQGSDKGANGGNAGNGEGGAGDGNNDGGAGGGGDDGGDGGDGGDGEDWGDWNAIGNKKKDKKKKKQQEEEEEARAKEEEERLVKEKEEEEQKKKAAEEAEAVTTNNDLSWADNAGNNDDDAWGGFTVTSKKKKKKAKGGADPAAAITTTAETTTNNNNSAFQDVSLDDSPPQLDLSFNPPETKKDTGSTGFGFGVWGKSWASGNKWGFGSFGGSDEGAKNNDDAAADDSNNPWSTSGAGKKDKKKTNGIDLGDLGADANDDADTVPTNGTTTEKNDMDWASFASVGKTKKKNKKNALLADDPPKEPELNVDPGTKDEIANGEGPKEPESSMADDIWSAIPSKKEKKKRGKQALDELLSAEPEPTPKPGPEPAPAADPPADPWAGLSKKELRKAKKAAQAKNQEPDPEPDPEPEPSPPAKEEVAEKVKEENAWTAVNLSNDIHEDGKVADAAVNENNDDASLGTSKKKKKDSFLSAADDLAEDLTPADSGENGWLSSWLQPGKKGKKNKKSQPVEDTPPPPPPEPEPEPEPEQGAEDEWSGWDVPRKDKKKKKAVDTALLEEDFPAIHDADESNHDPDSSMASPKDKKGKKDQLVEPEPEPEPQPEPTQEPAVVEQPAEPEQKPPALPDNPLYNNWVNLSSKDRKKREKTLKKKGLPIPDRNGVLPTEAAVESIPEATAEQTEHTSRLIPGRESEPEAEVVQEEPVEPAPEPPVELVTEENGEYNDDSWGIWNPFKEKKKTKRGKVVEELDIPLPPPAPTPPPAFYEPRHAPMDDVDPELAWDAFGNTANIKSTKKSSSKSKSSSKQKDFEEKKPDSVPEEPPAKAARGFWATFGAASTAKPKTTKSKTEEKPKASANDMENAQTDDILIDVGDDAAKEAEPPVPPAEEEPIRTKSKTSGKLSVGERIRPLEEATKEREKEKVPNKAKEIISEEPAPSKESKSTSKNSLKKEPSAETQPIPIEEDRPSRDALPGSFPDALDDILEPEPESPPKQEPEPPAPEPVKSSKKSKKSSKKSPSTAKVPEPMPEAEAPPEPTLEPVESLEDSEDASKEATTAPEEAPPSEELEPPTQPDEAKDENDAGASEGNPQDESPRADAPSTPPKPAMPEPEKSVKKERTRQRTPVHASWGLLGAAVPSKKTLKKEVKPKDAAAATKTRDSGPKDGKSSGSDKDSREARPSAPARGISFNNFIFGVQPPPKTKSPPKTEAPVTKPKPISRRPSVDEDEIDTPSKPPGKKPATSNKVPMLLGVNGANGTKSHSRRRTTGPVDPYVIDSEDDFAADRDGPETQAFREDARGSRDSRRRSRRKSKPKYYDDADIPRHVPRAYYSGADNYIDMPLRRPSIKRSNTVPKRPESGGLMGLFGSFRKATRPEVTETRGYYHDEDRRYMTDPEREEARDRHRRRRSRPDPEAEGYVTDGGPVGAYQTDAEDEEARRASRRARRASRHVTPESNREDEFRDAEERRRQRRRERALAQEEYEREERRRAERRARRVAREERRAREEEAREAAARAEAVREAERRERMRKRERERERERERRRIREEEQRELSRHASTKSRRRSVRVDRDRDRYERDYMPDDYYGRRHSHRPGDERARSQRRRSHVPDNTGGVPPMAAGRADKISSWVYSQADDPPEPPPVVGTVVDDPLSTTTPHTHSLSSDEEARRRIRRHARRRSKYPGMTDEEIEEVRSRQRAARRAERDGVKTSSGSGDYEREERGRSSRIFDLPPVANWFKKLTG
ncbi:hypothetical protein MAP00_000402 [Monascus purpureus]|nr:hypothetical protein MAP00_000402 [Monascus purpureus]